MTKFAPEELASWVFDPRAPNRGSDIGSLEDQLLFATYANEALFFWKFLAPLLEQKKPARGLEVGGRWVAESFCCE